MATTISATATWDEYDGTVGTTVAQFIVPEWVRVVVLSNTHASQTLRVLRPNAAEGGAGSGGHPIAAGGSLAWNLSGGQAQASLAKRTLALYGSGASTSFSLLLLAAQ